MAAGTRNLGGTCRRVQKGSLVVSQAHDVLDARLLSSVQSQDATEAEEALEHIYRLHAESVFSFITRCSGDAALARHVVEEVFVHLWGEPESCHPSQGTLRSCLIKQAYRRWAAVGGSEVSQNGSGVVPSMGCGETVDPWSRLRFEERLCVGLAHFGGMTIHQIACLLSVEEAAVMLSLSEGLSRLASAD